jgi:acyl dehydratase
MSGGDADGDASDAERDADGTSETPAERYSEPRYFEEVPVGERASFGAYEVTEAEIVEYAERYDPQPFHADPQHAAEADAFFDSVIAPGWLTASISQRLLVEHYFPSMHNVAASGCDEVRWHRPVTPGDVLTCRIEVLEKDAHREERGTIDVAFELRNEAEERAFSAIGYVVVRRRD